MFKKYLLLAAGILTGFGAYAEILTPDEALLRASSGQNSPRKISTISKPSLAYTSRTAKGEPSVYVFNKADGDGYLMLSADGLAAPVLGYTDSGNFDPANIPPQLKYWMDEYGNQIEYARMNAGEIKTETETMTFPSSWSRIDPLLETKWGQDNPFNSSSLIPKFQGSVCPTGCVATAMAQVMYYWKHPQKGTGTVSYTNQYTNQKLSMNFDQMPAFDWDNMLPAYVRGQYNETQAAAVANLMVQCGYSIQMQYASQSGTQTELVAPALMTYFGYGKGATCEQRTNYSATAWNELAYSQIKNVGPVVYGGASTEGAHCFVMDGYDGDGYFHMNWGWNGTCNGFYLLNALNPTQQGTGGYYGGYNFTQAMVCNVQLKNSDPVADQVLTLTLNGSLEGSMTSSVLTFTVVNSALPSLGNDTMSPMYVLLGIEITKADGSGEPVYVQATTPVINATFPPGSYFDLKDYDSKKEIPIRARFDSSLPDGKYKVTLVCKNTNSYGDGQWHHLNHGEENFDYIYVTKAGSDYTVENIAPHKLKISQAAITSPLYYNNPCLVELTIENPYDHEFTQSVIPMLYDLNGYQAYLGENRLVTLMPNETVTMKINTNFQKLTGALTPSLTSPVDFQLGVINYITGESYGTYGQVTMNRTSSNAKLILKSLKFTNAEGGVTIDNMGYVNGISNFSNIAIELSAQASGGFIATPITAIVWEWDVETNQGISQVYEKDFEDLLYLTSNELGTVSTSLNFNNADPWKMYLLALYYVQNGSRVQFANSLFTSTGVKDVTEDSDGLTLNYDGYTVSASSSAQIAGISIFDAGGATVASSAGDSIDISELQKGLYIVWASDSNGEVKTLKIMK